MAIKDFIGPGTGSTSAGRKHDLVVAGRKSSTCREYTSIELVAIMWTDSNACDIDTDGSSRAKHRQCYYLPRIGILVEEYLCQLKLGKHRIHESTR